MLKTLALALTLGFAIPAGGQTTLKATVGWGNAMRLGRWTPVFVTVADPKTTSIDLQVHATHGVAAAMLVRQTAVAQLQPTMYALLFPIDADPAHAVVAITDEQTGKTLLQPDGSRAIQLLQDPASFTAAGNTPVRVLAADDTLIGLSGNIGDAALVQAQFASIGLVSGILRQTSLPDNPIGYEGITMLTLAGADLSQMDGMQQHAIVDWIRRGGNLLLIPGADAMPEQNMLEEFLPCRIGANRLMSLPASSAATQPSQLNGRELIPRPGATPLYPFGQPRSAAGWIGYTAPLGLGRITVLPADIAPLQFANNAGARDFWRQVLSGMATVPAKRAVTSIEVSVEQEDIIPVGPKQSDSVGRGPRETFAVRHVLEAMGAAPVNVGTDWRAMLLMLAGLFALLGPVDSVLLMQLGQPPRHWLTLIGWIGLLAASTGLVIKRSSTEPPRVATFRLIDQADGVPVAATDLAAVESDHPAKVPLDLDENEWWEPANQVALNFSKDRFVDMDFHQDLHGCGPQSLQLTAGEPQSLRGETSVSGSTLLDGSLSVRRDASGQMRVSGTLGNRSSVEMTDIQVATSAGNCRINQPPLAPGAWIRVDEPLSPQPIAFTGLPADVLDVSPDRNARVGVLIDQGNVGVYCQMPAANGVKTADGVAAANHWQVLRAVMPTSR